MPAVKCHGEVTCKLLKWLEKYKNPHHSFWNILWTVFHSTVFFIFFRYISYILKNKKEEIYIFSIHNKISLVFQIWFSKFHPLVIFFHSISLKAYSLMVKTWIKKHWIKSVELNKIAEIPFYISLHYITLTGFSNIHVIKPNAIKQ